MAKLKINEQLFFIFLFCLFFFVIYNFFLIPRGFLENHRLSTFDNYFRLAHRFKIHRDVSSNITLITIDDKSLSAIGKKWPWERSYFAEIVDKISIYHPAVIALDFTFSGLSKDPAEDQRLAEAFSNAGNVIFASYLTGEMQYLPLNEDLLKSAWGTGFVNKPRDIDYKIRRAQLVQYRYDQKEPEYSFEVMLVAKYLGLEKEDLIFGGKNIIFGNDLVIPLIEGRIIPIYYTHTFSDFSSISLVDLMEGNVSKKDLENRIVILGTGSEAAQDFHATPLGMLSGLVLNANVVNTIYNNNILKSIDYRLQIIILFSFLLISVFLTYYSTFSRGIIEVFFMSAAVYLVFFWFFLKFKLIFPVFDSFFLIGITFVAVNIYKYTNLLYRASRLRKLAITDGITGLATSRYFQYKLQADLAHLRHHHGELSLVVFTLNQFRDVLTDYDYECAEKLLQHFAGILKYNSRKKADLLTRLGEDRFGAILPRTSVNESVSYSRKIQKKLSELPFNLPKGAVKLDLSTGVASYPELSVKSAYEFIKCAETAANRSRQTHESICIFSPAVDGIPIEGLRKEIEISEKDQMGYLTMDIEERNKELANTLKELLKRQCEIQEAYFNTIKSLVRALEEKDPYTAGHSERVCEYAVKIASEMNLPKDEVELIRQTAMLHDVGKIGMKDSILHKRGPLTEEEQEIMKKHTIAGSHILGETKFFEKHIPLIVHHHERYDGGGYPHGISGDSIPAGAQIIALADTLDAMTTGRGYNRVMTFREAIEEIKKNAGTQFNPVYVDALIKAFIVKM